MMTYGWLGRGLAPWLVMVMSACAAPPDGRGQEAAATMETPDADATPDVLEATSLLGAPLYRPALSDERRVELEADLAEAEASLEAAPDDPARIVWVGRREAYLGRYQAAIATYSRGIERHPDVPHLYRHRGHRYITTRQLDLAVADLERAAALVAGQPDEIEPDGAPNPANIPRSTLHFNIYYHLGLAHYLRGDFAAALDAYLRCMETVDNDDSLVAIADWLYMTYRRLGRDADAAAVLESIAAGMEILENTAYHQRLLMYKGEIEPSTLLDPDGTDPLQLATQGYGVGNWYLYNGNPDRARAIFQEILDGGSWAAFGFIAAEAELQRGL